MYCCHQPAPCQVAKRLVNSPAVEKQVVALAETESVRVKLHVVDGLHWFDCSLSFWLGPRRTEGARFAATPLALVKTCPDSLLKSVIFDPL